MSQFPPSGDRPPNYITPLGHRRLTEEMEQLQLKERPRVVQEVADAAAQGDRSENAEYIYGKKRLREIDSRLRFLAGRLRDVVVVDPAKQKSDRVVFGASVELENADDGQTVKYQIVGVDETDPDRGLLSWRSPLGRLLLGKHEGDSVVHKTPRGTEIEYVVTRIVFGS